MVFWRLGVEPECTATIAVIIRIKYKYPAGSPSGMSFGHAARSPLACACAYAVAYGGKPSCSAVSPPFRRLHLRPMLCPFAVR
ncbi:MAG: hypothetical protein KME57_11305 [Scytonema hyalinum WJT4-NPBG1]|nr:hypothetical protein [Scytonema hyalinum WJT4-NPBG1]